MARPAANRSENLIRKQVMLSNNNIVKLEKLSNKDKSSLSQVVRNAIDNFEPDDITSSPGVDELLDLVSVKLKSAISDTKRTRQLLSKTLTKIEGTYNG